jgi:hypothetical protein
VTTLPAWQITTMVRRLTAHWQRSSANEKRLGKTWYSVARSQARELAQSHEVSLSCAAGVIAALSPRQFWARNVAVARACLARRPVLGVFRANLAKAEAIRGGAKPLSVLGGPKVRAFYRAITGDKEAAVVDTWVLRALGLTATGLTARVYRRIAAAMSIVAKTIRTSIATLQAVVWVTVRGRAI